MTHHTLTTYQILQAFAAVPFGLTLAIGAASIWIVQRERRGFRRTAAAKFRRRK